MDEIERALALSQLIESDLLTRKDVWPYTEDESAIVRKIAVYALKKPVNERERKRYWDAISTENEGGVRALYAFGLLQDAKKKRSVTNGFRMHVTTTGLLGGA